MPIKPEYIEENVYCSVCDTVGPGTTCASGIAPVSYGICGVCFDANAEPIGILIRWWGMHHNTVNPDFVPKFEGILQRSLERSGITREVYEARVQNAMEYFDAHQLL